MATLTTSTQTTTATPSVRTAGTIAGTVALIGTAANLLLLAIGNVAGAELIVDNAGTATSIGIPPVVLGSILPLIVGFAVLALATRWGARGWNIVAGVGLAVALLTAPMALLTAQASAGTGIILGAMHVTIGAAWFFLIRKSLPATA